MEKRTQRYLNGATIKARANLLAEVQRAGVELRQRGHEWKGLCPFHQEKTPSFSVDPQKGFWYCFGCGRGGDVIDFVMEAYRKTFPEACELLSGRRVRPDAPPPAPATKNGPTPKEIEQQQRDYRQLLAGLLPYAESPAEAYLCGRSLTIWPHICAVKYHPAWCWKNRRDIRPAVVFPLRDANGALVATQGRYFTNKPVKVRTAQPFDGAAGTGVFSTPGAFDSLFPLVVVVESPINAITLASAGFPSIATCGAGHFPAWLPTACAGKRVLIGFDPDPAGAKGTLALAQAIYAATGQIAEELPITVPGMDWNDILIQYGYADLRAVLQRVIKPGGTPSPPGGQHAGEGYR